VEPLEVFEGSEGGVELRWCFRDGLEEEEEEEEEENIQSHVEEKRDEMRCMLV
jgi:hypothetical protein